MGKMSDLAITIEESKMTKDLIIGNASGYEWDDLKYWVNSIAMSGFQGDVILTGTNMSKNTIDNLTDRGVKLNLYGKVNEAGDVVSKDKGIPHVDRFFYIWNALNELEEKYRYVVTTDTRDVVFQANPIEFLEYLKTEQTNWNLPERTLVASSEGMYYKDEPWGNSNLFQAMGPFFHNKIKEKLIYNVGVIAGEFDMVRDVMLMIFQLSMTRPIAIVDQAVYNFLLSVPMVEEKTVFTHNDHGWAIQLGTTEEAVKSGSGDLGIQYRTNPKRYRNLYHYDQPEFRDGLVINPVTDEPFYVVHQYDRIPDLKAKVHEKYGELNAITYGS